MASCILEPALAYFGSGYVKYKLLPKDTSAESRQEFAHTGHVREAKVWHVPHLIGCEKKHHKQHERNF
jgi:hypothetical protein